MILKRTLAAVLVSACLLCNTQIVYAEEIEIENSENVETTEENEVETSENVETTEENINDVLIDVEDLDTQINGLYEKVSEKIGINVEYIRQLHMLAGAQATYADKKPNIYNDETSTSLSEPMKLYNANTVYQKAEFIECGDDKIERASGYYLPDAVYSVSYDIYALMTQRYLMNRNGMQIYFNSLKEEVKQQIVFYEAVLLYTGESEESVNNLFKAYEKILYDKQSNENIVETDENRNIVIKDKFLDILTDIGITDTTRLNYLAILLSFDSNLAINDNVENIKDEYIVPYKLNYTSRENMMIAGICLVGKVRYVWGGGHSGASYIDGINPVWSMWNSLYPSTPTSEVTNEETGETSTVNNTGFRTCIKPSGSWCPTHGFSAGECSQSELIHSLDEYIQLRSKLFDTSDLQSDKYTELLSKVDYTDGISVHTLDGLDCSGFASWLYNQITDKYELNTTAMNFINQAGIEEVPFGSELLPGDIFTWTEHIVIVIGKVKDNSKAYVTIEQTTNVLKFGVIYYSGASSADIQYATQLAEEANQLIGGLDKDSEPPHVYCMNNVGYYSEDVIDEETGDVIDTVSNEYRAIGRFKLQFIDKNIRIGEKNIPIEDMCAIDIIQYTLTKLPISYVSGYNLYDGSFLNKDLISSNLGVTIIEE